MQQDVYLVPGVRTPFVRAGGQFAHETSLSLSTTVLRSMTQRTRPDLLVWGQVIPNVALSNIAREAAMDAGLDPTIPAYSTQLACATSMVGAIQAASMIGRGGVQRALVGGVELMSRVPIGLTDEAAARVMATAMSAPQEIPALLASMSANDVNLPRRGWTNRISGRSMGEHMEESASAFTISREDQDRIAYLSHRNAALARERGFFDDLLVAHGDVSVDGLIRTDTTLEKLASLKPAFAKEGSLTAGNSSPLTDGAAGLWVTSASGRLEIPNGDVAARLVDWELGAVDFREDGMLMAPAWAIARLLRRHGLLFADIDLWEVHEAFAAQVLANIHVAEDPLLRSKHSSALPELGAFPWDRLNPNGGSLALGHPFAATGARILSQTVKTLSQMPRRSKAIVSICADGGQGAVVLLERS